MVCTSFFRNPYMGRIALFFMTQSKLVWVAMCAASICGVSAWAAEPSAASPDVGAHEHWYARPTPVPSIEEIYDGARYGEDASVVVYVAPNGSDSAAGTFDEPLLTLAAGVSRASARLGEAGPEATAVVRLAAGEYEIREPVDVPPGVSIEGAVPCGASGGVASGAMTVLFSTNLVHEFTYHPHEVPFADEGTREGRILRLKSEAEGPDYATTDGRQHLSNIFFDGRRAAAGAIEVWHRDNVAIHDCAVVDFTRLGVGWRASADGATGMENEDGPQPAAFPSGGRFFRNYMKDNTYFGLGYGEAPDGKGQPYGRGALFCYGLRDFRIYGNTIIEDCRTAPLSDNTDWVDHVRGMPIKFWYYEGWMLGCKIHDNVIQKLGSTVSSSDRYGWDFAIESHSHFGLEVCHNRFIGAVDLNRSRCEVPGVTNYAYGAWIHDNTFSADPDAKRDLELGRDVDYEQWAIVLENRTLSTVVERNYAENCEFFVFFNARDCVSNVVIRSNVCTNMGGVNGSFVRLDGIIGDGVDVDHLRVEELSIHNNTFIGRTAVNENDPACGLAVSIGQAMDSWTSRDITVANNVVANTLYGGVQIGNNDDTWDEKWEHIIATTNYLISATGVSIENNFFHNVGDWNGCVSLTVPERMPDAVTADNHDDETDSGWWAAAFVPGSWLPAEGSLLIDAGRSMTNIVCAVPGEGTDFGNNPVLATAAPPPPSWLRVSTFSLANGEARLGLESNLKDAVLGGWLSPGPAVDVEFRDELGGASTNLTPIVSGVTLAVELPSNATRGFLRVKAK